ncbi:hypothetical protein PSAB_23640 [Paenibacillus sabinae T27]|uniref:Uncharacterized protein n=1 Tax=Paenibacillus sabinae T27 TaxID=1268072 RepID=X4ZT33_9BACL|nr:hypothetical protein PSAB_23640 [Paenibacillus sabinae T27]
MVEHSAGERPFFEIQEFIGFTLITNLEFLRETHLRLERRRQAFLLGWDSGRWDLRRWMGPPEWKRVILL